jgi:Arc/MetJ-type ribon-helix-helix transcriptional regulator
MSNKKDEKLKRSYRMPKEMIKAIDDKIDGVNFDSASELIRKAVNKYLLELDNEEKK